MTIEEAIAFFKDMNECTYGNLEAVEMAIKALKQQPCEDCISRADVLGLAKKGVLISNSNYQSVCKAINELPSVTPIRKNSISRQAVYEQINCWIGSGEYRYTNATDYLIKRITDIESLEQQLCEDCISREKAKQFLYERLDRLNDDELYDIFSRIIDDMYNELPPVTLKAESEAAK
ncbi:hypothetical protein SAMN05660484_02165 [Eubacterium ruminantium]|uniref:Uncharacterized protein n=1 Tax=Eubacterium ruminantium TaxID=42322 RepID=A0A1T4QQM5_9FIRM|nr:hypothetical protein [Eubacterium ruminantium]SCW63329.1 hypothetical protein SAMN05660484_02165 [Eubacterium ruminantium]SDN45452.1 hypothetical protein SAMN04490370_12533 [Eubacterium ruminantium]SKA05984.1 hypothetical protein SAMN02745110_02472 [Eubacterium ruminantium]